MRRLIAPGLIAAFLLGFPGAIAPGARADEPQTLEERQHERADQLRRGSTARAKALLERETLPEQAPANRFIDFHTLTLQAARLGALLQQLALEAQMAEKVGRSAPSPLPGIPSETEGGMYGPEGPTARSVKAILEYRLVLLGNPRLTVGDISEDEEKVVAEVVTKHEGSLVEKYVIDKETGAWKPAR